MVTRKIAVYDFRRLQLQPLTDTSFLQGPFYLQLTQENRDWTEKVLLSVPDALEIRRICRSYDDDVPEISSIRGEGCFYYGEENAWILDVSFTTCNALTGIKETCALRLPLSMPGVTKGPIGLYYDGTWLRFMKDGEILNENKGADRFEPSGALWVDPELADAMVAEAADVPVSYREVEEAGSGDFYMPGGWNAFAGDVMNFYHNGTYHVLYLLDRRHHMSWNGKGAHYIAQVTSNNLIDWQEQELVAPIREPWESFGTGTMVYHHGKYYMSYGLHTERYVRKEEPNPFWNRMQFPTIEADEGICREIPFREILAQGNVPVGATYAVSEDGIHFTPSERLYHTARNPSLYTNEAGGLTLWAGLCQSEAQRGVWESPEFGAPFIRSEENWDSIKHPLIPYSTECPSLFQWNGYQYLIIGWSGYFRTKTAGDAALFDAIAAGESIYDGLGVPMVCSYENDRKLMAGWIRSIGWGSVILHRELIQEDGGKLGMKWVPEMVPATRGEDLLAGVDLNRETAELDPRKSYLLTVTIHPGAAKRMGLIFANETGAACELQLDFARGRVQFGDGVTDGLADPIPALFEMADQLKDCQNPSIWQLENIPQQSINFCLPDVPGMEAPFALRILCRCSGKMDSTVIDAEIAGRRTIVSGRQRLFPNQLQVRWDGDGEILSAGLEELRDLVQ